MTQSYDRRQGSTTRVAYDKPAEAIAKAIGLLDYLPNAAAFWVEAHGGNNALARKNGVIVKKVVRELGAVLASMPQSVSYEVATNGGTFKFKDRDALLTWARQNHIEVFGYFNNPRTRAELQGQPVLESLVGPMYGGPGKVRYETDEVYESLSR